MIPGSTISTALSVLSAGSKYSETLYSFTVIFARRIKGVSAPKFPRINNNFILFYFIFFHQNRRLKSPFSDLLSITN